MSSQTASSISSSVASRFSMFRFPGATSSPLRRCSPRCSTDAHEQTRACGQILHSGQRGQQCSKTPADGRHPPEPRHSISGAGLGLHANDPTRRHPRARGGPADPGHARGSRCRRDHVEPRDAIGPHSCGRADLRPRRAARACAHGRHLEHRNRLRRAPCSRVSGSLLASARGGQTSRATKGRDCTQHEPHAWDNVPRHREPGHRAGLRLDRGDPRRSKCSRPPPHGKPDPGPHHVKHRARPDLPGQQETAPPGRRTRRRRHRDRAVAAASAATQGRMPWPR